MSIATVAYSVWVLVTAKGLFLGTTPYELECFSGLVSVVVFSFVKDMSLICVVVANSAHHGSHESVLPWSQQQPCLGVQ